jgi:hypothetical protein
MDTTMNITNADLRPALSGARRAPHAIRPDSLPRALFVAELLDRRLVHVARDAFRGDPAPARVSRLGTPVLIRSDPGADEVEAFWRMPTGEIALLDAGHGHIRVEVAGETLDGTTCLISALRAALATERSAPDRVSISFWMRGEWGGDVRHRQIDAETFAEIAGNYSAPVRAALEQLIDRRAPERGRLILWRGEPGTGKSHALRALVRAWTPWCSAHFIMDPEELLGHGGAYMLDVLTWDGADEDRWRLLILEDAGELITADARAMTGRALSRLLNVTDGLLGQGTRTMLLITTNEPVGRLHPATRRPGRCLADIEFTPLTRAEANAWLAARGHSRRVDRPVPLAELFGAESDAPVEAGSAVPAFGFARALDADVR